MNWLHRADCAVLTMEIQRGVVGDLSSFPQLAEAAARRRRGANTARLLVARPFAQGARGPLHGRVPGRPGRVRRSTASWWRLPSATPIICWQAPPPTELVEGWAPSPGTWSRSRLHGVSPFTGTSLDTWLRSLGVRTVVATGVSVNLGLLGLAIEAVNLGYRVVVPRDTVAGVPEEYADAVLDQHVPAHRHGHHGRSAPRQLGCTGSELAVDPTACGPGGSTCWECPLVTVAPRWASIGQVSVPIGRWTSLIALIWRLASMASVRRKANWMFELRTGNLADETVVVVAGWRRLPRGILVGSTGAGIGAWPRVAARRRRPHRPSPSARRESATRCSRPVSVVANATVSWRFNCQNPSTRRSFVLTSTESGGSAVTLSRQVGLAGGGYRPFRISGTYTLSVVTTCDWTIAAGSAKPLSGGATTTLASD